jgi:hypothetical protein
MSGQVSALCRVQKRAAKFANNINESGSVNFGTAKNDSPNMRPFQGIHWETGLESDMGQTSKPMLSDFGRSES